MGNIKRTEIRRLGLETVAAGPLGEKIEGGSLVLDTRNLSVVLKADKGDALVHIEYSPENNSYSFVVYKKP